MAEGSSLLIETEKISLMYRKVHDNDLIWPFSERNLCKIDVKILFNVKKAETTRFQREKMASRLLSRIKQLDVE